MRRAIYCFGILLGLSAVAGEARAQNFSDPFFLYYGYFLPRQAAMAATPTVNDTLNAVTAARQGNTQTNRATLFDPNGNYAPLDDFDGPQDDGPDARAANLKKGRFPSGNISGSGPSLYYARTARYYPGQRTGRSVNRNVYVGRARRGGGAGLPAMRPGMGGGVGRPGPR